jgi:hypothetical protein
MGLDRHASLDAQKRDQHAVDLRDLTADELAEIQRGLKELTE